MKHAAATNIWVTLSQNEERLKVVIRDDGRGFDSGIHRKGIGNGCTLSILFPVKLAVEDDIISTVSSLN